MAKQKATFEKRAREMDRQKKRKEKQERRVERNKEKDENPTQKDGDDDPDLAGIVAGPQPINHD